MKRVVHFQLPADDPERAMKFYGDIFGWKFEKWSGPMEWWMIVTGEGEPGINGGMGRRMYPGDTVIDTVEVASVDETAAKIQAHGGQITVPKMAIPGVGWLGFFRDTEGNTFGIMETDEEAGT